MAGIAGVIVAGGGSATAHYTNKTFAKLMSTSAKMSLPVMAGLMLFTYK